MGEERCHFSFMVNGYPVQASYAQTFIDTVVYPLIEHWRSLAATRKERIVVFLAAPPAAGKSTLSLLFEHLSAMDGKARIQALGMDGFRVVRKVLISTDCRSMFAVSNRSAVSPGRCMTEAFTMCGMMRSGSRRRSWCWKGIICCWMRRHGISWLFTVMIRSSSLPKKQRCANG